MNFNKLFKLKQLPLLPKDKEQPPTEETDQDETEKNIKLYEMKQLPLIPKDKKLQQSDFKKIFKNLPNKDIFGDTCTEWIGVICNADKPKKGQYINYYMNKKKTTLHRVLFENFKNAQLRDKAYLVHTCNNKRCCCINHLIIKKERHELPKKDNLIIDFNVSF